MPEVLNKWRILDIIKASETALKDKGILNPRLNAEVLLAGTLNTTRINLYLDFDKPLTESEITSYREKIKRRMKHEPLQYITGFTEFYGLKFKVNPSVLIPRQETEILVEKCIEVIYSVDNPKILEIGTGSGCISVSIAKNAPCIIDAIDISDDALALAKENAELNEVSSINFQNKNALTDLKNFNDYDILISNPPYIPADEIETLSEEVKDFEPFNALTDNSDGTVFYRKIFELASVTSKPIDIILEIGDRKKEIIENLLKEYSFNDHTFYKDLINIPRVLHIKSKQT